MDDQIQSAKHQESSNEKAQQSNPEPPLMDRPKSQHDNNHPTSEGDKQPNIEFEIPESMKKFFNRVWNWTKKTSKDANLAEWAMTVTAFLMVVTSVLQWVAVRGQLEQMRSDAIKNQDTFATSQKAYVTIGRPDGIVADIIWPKDEKGNAGLLVYFQNSGRLPAKFNWGADSTIIAVVPSDPAIVSYEKWKEPHVELPTNHLFQPMFRARARKGTQVEWSGTIDIPGGSSFQGVLWETPRDRMVQIINFQNMFMPSGKFEYCDGFGKRICKTFSFRYAKEPFNRFFLSMEDECPAYEMQIIHPMPDYDYLPPCDISERPEITTTLPGLPKP